MLVLAVGPALPAPEGFEQEGLAEVEQEAEPLEFDYAVDVVALGQPFVVELVEVAVIADIVEGSFDYFVEQVLDVEVLD